MWQEVLLAKNIQMLDYLEIIKKLGLFIANGHYVRLFKTNFNLMKRQWYQILIIKLTVALRKEDVGR